MWPQVTATIVLLASSRLTLQLPLVMTVLRASSRLTLHSHLTLAKTVLRASSRLTLHSHLILAKTVLLASSRLLRLLPLAIIALQTLEPGVLLAKMLRTIARQQLVSLAKAAPLPLA
jgi:hypothetical protein